MLKEAMVIMRWDRRAWESIYLVFLKWMLEFMIQILFKKEKGNFLTCLPMDAVKLILEIINRKSVPFILSVSLWKCVVWAFSMF